MIFKESVIEKIKMKVKGFAVTEFPKKLEVSVVHDTPPFMNNRCQFNAVNMVRAKKAVAVVECVLIDSDGCTAHYINMLEDGSYVDYTLGWSWSGGDYRFSRFVHENEYGTINASLGNLKSRLTKGFIGNKAKLFNINKWDLC